MIYKQLIYAHMKGILYDPLACKNSSTPVKIQFLDYLNLTQETECPSELIKNHLFCSFPGHSNNTLAYIYSVLLIIIYNHRK